MGSRLLVVAETPSSSFSKQFSTRAVGSSFLCAGFFLVFFVVFFCIGPFSHFYKKVLRIEKNGADKIS